MTWTSAEGIRLAARIDGLNGEGALDVLARARALEARGRKVAHVEVGEPDFPTPPHVVEAGAAWRVHREIARSAEKWVEVVRHADARACLDALRAAGYRIVAASPAPDAPPLAGLELRGPTAVLFGNELEGLSPAFEAGADERFRIPLRGFVQSLNVSVTVGIALERLVGGLERLPRERWQLPAAERERLILAWTRMGLRSAGRILAAYRNGTAPARTKAGRRASRSMPKKGC